MPDDPTRVLFGMAGFNVLVAMEFDHVLHVLIETDRAEAPCPGCGEFSDKVKQRPVVRVADAPSHGRRVIVWWRKRRLRCTAEGCVTITFTERHVAIGVRARITRRLADVVALAVKGRSVAAVAAEHALSWATVWRATKRAIEDELARRKNGPPARLGLDETTFLRHQRYATGLVDLDTGLLVELLEGRSKKLVVDWLCGLCESDRRAIIDVAMDPYAGYAAAIRQITPHARITVDKFHAVKLVNKVCTDVRCRRNQELTGHRGRKHDPLYRGRHDLLRARERLRPRGQARLDLAFRIDGDGGLAAAWLAKECFRDIYLCRDRASAHAALVAWYHLVVDLDVPEITTFATTVSQWEKEFLNYFDSGLTNARTEGRNLTIKGVKRSGYGFRSFENYRLRVLYRCG